MKRKATEELIADRPPPVPEMQLKSASVMGLEMTKGTASMGTTTGTEATMTTGPELIPTTTTPTTGSATDTGDPTAWSNSLGHTPTPTTASPSAVTTASRRFPSDLKTIRCTWPDCNKTFNRPARLTAHMRSHTNDRPFQCPDCPKTYLEEKHLRQHVKGSHTQERRYVCPTCSKAFLTATRLRRHAAVHEGQDRFRCSGYDASCTRTFRKHQTLQRHIRVDHLQQPAFCCTHEGGSCTAMFESAGALRRHVEREHAPPKFWCAECATDAGETADAAPVAGFATKQLLESHMRQHHANCLFCDARCAGPAELLRHVDMYHAGKTVADRKTIVCPHAGCGKTFVRRANRNVHIRAAHEGLRFVCGTSGRGGQADIAADDVDVDADDDDDDDDEENNKNNNNNDNEANSESHAPSARLAIAEWHMRNEGCGRGFVSKMKLEEHILYVHLGHDRPPPCKVDVNDNTENTANTEDASANIIEALLGTNRTLACIMPGCTARFVRHHDLNTHIQRDHTDASAPASDDHAFWMGDDAPGDSIPASDMFTAFIDMNASDLNANMTGMLADDVQWQMNEAEMRQLIGNEGSEGAGASFLDPDLFL